MPSLSLRPWVNVTYTISAIAAARRGFNLGLIVGPSDVIDPTDRVEIFTGLDQMIDAGFTSNMPEYIAASLYFSAVSNPTQVAIGRQASGETPLQAVTACRVANSEWYGVYVCDLSDSDILAVAAYIEAVTPYSTFFVNTDDSDVLNNVSGNLFEELKDANYRRTLGLYSQVEHAIAGMLGYVMGATRDTANSAYTIKFKRLPGVTVDDLTEQQVTNIETNLGNVYVNRGTYYDGFENGSTFGGVWFDEVIFTDKLVNEIQLSIADLFYTNPKIPQTEPGMSQVRTVAGNACQKSVYTGFLAPGEWTGPQVMSLQPGDVLPAGYIVFSQAIDEQSPADREARLAPPLYVCIKEAGAIQSSTVEIIINR